MIKLFFKKLAFLFIIKRHDIVLLESSFLLIDTSATSLEIRWKTTGNPLRVIRSTVLRRDMRSAVKGCINVCRGNA